MIIDPKINRIGRGARRLGRCESSLIDFMVCHDLVDRFHLDHPRREMWTWLDSLPSIYASSYLDSVLVKRADTDFVICSTFHYIIQHKHVSGYLRLPYRLSLSCIWKFNTSLLEIWDFWDQLESLVQWALVGAVTGNKWWGSRKHKIRDFITKYSLQFNLDRTKDKLSRAVERGDSQAIDLARQDLECEASECYKGYAVKSKLKRVPNEAMNATCLHMRKKYEDSLLGISNWSSPRMGMYSSQIVRCMRPFGCTSIIPLFAVLTSWFRSFEAIQPTSPAFEWLKWLAARVSLLNAKSVMRWSRLASTNHQD